MNNSLFPAVILSGGLATRLHPTTLTIPKSLIEINGKPFVSHQLQLLKKNGIKKVIICVGYLGEKIKDFIGNGDRFGLQVFYSSDGPTLLGTAGAIKQSLPLLPDHFFVLYGDSFLPCDYAAVQKAFFAANKMALMTVFRNDGQWDTSNVEFRNERILNYDKKCKTDQMHYIDYGLGVFNKKAFANLHDDICFDLAEIYQQLLKQDQLSGYEVKERFYEVGSFSGIKEFSYYLTKNTTI